MLKAACGETMTANPTSPTKAMTKPTGMDPARKSRSRMKPIRAPSEGVMA